MSRKYLQAIRVAVTCIVLALSACGGDESGGGGIVISPPPPPPSGIGAAGGTALGPHGAKVVVPPGALSVNVDIRVEQNSVGAPPLPAGLATSGPMFAFTPHGTAFAVPATITMPFDPALVPAGNTAVLYKTNAQSQWELVAGATFGADDVTAQISGFSHAQVIVVPPLTRNEPVRSWEFMVYSRTTASIVSGPDGSGSQTGGMLDRLVHFGQLPLLLDGDMNTYTGTVPADGLASGFVFGSADGATYGVFAEAPFGKLGGINQPGDPQPIGAYTSLDQRQSFIKRADDATLQFTLSAVEICAFDYNLFPPTFGTDDEHTAIRGAVYFDVQAWTTQTQRFFFSTSGAASVRGSRNGWGRSIQNFATGSTQELWADESFDFATEAFTDEFGSGTDACLELSGTLTYEVELATIAIGEEFTLRSVAQADVVNRRGGGAVGDHQGSGVYAYLRDPIELGGATIVFNGLEPTNRPDLVTPIQVPVAPAACVPGPGPDTAAGVLEFSAGHFSIDESAGSLPVVAVERTGGSSGAVSATFTAGDGTAAGGADYAPVNITVFFADGQSEPQFVRIPVTADALIEPDETVALTLSQPGGCGALGPQSSAILTIVSDDQPPFTGTPGALDTAFGNAGKSTAAAFGGDRSAMALQSDGKIVMVGGTFADFVLARFNADGSLDAAFDTDGKVTTDMIAGEQEEALAVAVQPDGRIVVAGYTGTAGPGGPANFALARYNTDGSLDATFGSAGRVVSGVQGQAYAVSIQADGKIVVAGEVALPSGADFSDFAVARYNANGTLDSTFSADGSLTTNIGGGTNTARNIVLLASGAIVVSGEPIGVFSGSSHTDIVKYDVHGSPDAAFGGGGMITLDGARVGEGLAVQRDGKLVLVGSVDVGVAPAIASQFAVRRLNGDGSPDAAFGTAGAVSIAFTDRGDSAFAVAIQPDGRIVVAGRSSGTLNPNFAVARLSVNGSLDTTFADAGRQTVDFFGFVDIAESVAMQDGMIVAGGLARQNVDGYGLVRLHP